MNRRQFLNKSIRSAAGISLAAYAGHSRAIGANERINIALVGCGGRGSYVARGLMEQGARLSFLCDVNPERIGKAAEFLAQVQEEKPQTTGDMRRVFDSGDVDAVVVATPDHWHAPASILAMQAGKDVYVEKPHCHNIREGQQMIEAARRHNRILEVGTQNRSAAYNKAAMEYVKSGKLGNIHIVKVYNLKKGGPFQLGQSEPMPDGMDWDRWLGDAAMRPWHSGLYNSGWHRFWDFSGGDMADDGIHQIDLALMVMGDPGLPRAVSCSGGKLAHPKDDGQTPDVQIAAFDFDKFVMTFELSHYPRYMEKTTNTIRRKDLFPYWTQNATRVELYGSEMMMTIGRHGGGWQATTSGGKVVEQMYGRFPDEEHQADFLEALKTRRKPSADIETANYAATMVHMANIAHRVGNKKLWYDAKAGEFTDCPEANALIKSDYRKGYEIDQEV